MNNYTRKKVVSPELYVIAKFIILSTLNAPSFGILICNANPLLSAHNLLELLDNLYIIHRHIYAYIRTSITPFCPNNENDNNRKFFIYVIVTIIMKYK